MDAMDRVIAEMSPADTVAALRLLNVLEECRQMDATEAEAWRRRITGWAWFNAVGAVSDASPPASPAATRSMLGARIEVCGSRLPASRLRRVDHQWLGPIAGH